MSSIRGKGYASSSVQILIVCEKSIHNLFLWRLASSLTMSTCARHEDELGLKTPSLNILSTLSWINNRSSWLKRRDLVAMGLTPSVRLENKLTSWVSATATTQVSSCETTISWRLPPSSKMTRWCWFWKSRPRMMSQQSVGRTFNLVNAYLLPLTTISVRQNPNDFTFTEVDAIRISCDEGYKVKLSLLQIDEWM